MTPNVPDNSAAGKRASDLLQQDDEPEALVGQIIADRYEVLELLGVGGMGCVYRARHVHIRKQVALKTLHAAMLRSPEVVARFEREAVAAASIDHPNVVVATDFGRLPHGRYYLVLEFIEGRDLRHELDVTGAMPLARALCIARQIASGLSAAHPLGIVHRDLKPENVMLLDRGNETDRIKVLDFGIAKMTLEDKGQPLTQLGAIFGTPQYMSPEQAKGQAVDARSDLYSLGVILFEMLTGKLPFEAADPLGYIMQHLNAAPPPLPSTIPDAIRTLVHQLLEKDPANRPATALEVAQQLERAIGVAPMRPSPTPSGHASRWHAWLASSIALMRPWLAQKRSIGKFQLASATWLLILFGIVLTVVLFWSVRRGADGAVRPDGSAASSLVPANPSTSLPTLPDAEYAREIERIEQLKVYQRTEQDWMILARGSVQLGRFEQAALAYQALLSLRPLLYRDRGLLADLFRASQDPKAFRVVVNLAEGLLGKHGIDLIWLMWERERNLPDHKEQAEKLGKKLVILSLSASPALRVAIELNFTTNCDKLLMVLARAVTDADMRSTARLKALSSRSGCGPSLGDDCYPCLRQIPLLEQATEQAKKTPAPALGDTATE